MEPDTKQLTKTSKIQLKFTPQQASFFSSLPSSFGVYIFEKKDSTPLYVGKAINIKTRIRQHLREARNKNSKQRIFIKKTHTLSIIPTTNDIQAIILEAELIRTLKPFYNSALKDDKDKINFIVFSNPPLVKIKYSRKKELKYSSFKNPRTQIYGPYQTQQTAKLLLKYLRRIFKYCSNPFNPQHRACFYYHLSQCTGACKGNLTKTEYIKQLTKCKRFLSGKFSLLQSDLTKEIKKYSKNKQFERAEQTKISLEKLNHLMTRPTQAQLLSYPQSRKKILTELLHSLKHPKLETPPRRMECFDIAHLQGENQVGGMSVFIDGQPQSMEYRHFIINPTLKGDPQALAQVIARRLKHTDWQSPDLIILDGGKAQLSIVSQTIKSNIPIIAISKRHETIHQFDKRNKIQDINLPLSSQPLQLIQFIRDEAHRFTNTFHKHRRTKTYKQKA